MRLIDELLKDDFFNGGYQPGVVTAAPTPVPSSAGGSKKLIFLVAGIVILLAAGGGGAFLFLKNKQPAATANGSAAQKLAAVVPPAQPAALTPEPVSNVAAPAAISQAAAATPPVEAQVAADLEVGTESSEPPAPAPIAVAPAKIAPVVAAPAPKAAAVEQAYILVFPKMTEKQAVDRVVAQLKEQGVSAKTKQSTAKTTIYKVVGVKPVPAAEANAVKLKASLFKVPANSTDNGDGTVSFDFGSYATPEEAREAASNVQKLGIDIKLGRTTADQPAYIISSMALSKENAERYANEFKSNGLAPSIEKAP